MTDSNTYYLSHDNDSFALRNIPRWKRLFDLFLCLVLVVPILIVMGLLVLLIRLSRPGPIFFRHRRLGLQGRMFEIIKFRTMATDAEERLKQDPELWNRYVENNYKLPEGEDPRLTPIGRFLRSTSLDELPQIFNIIRGDMSFVGPRPIVSWELEKYGDEAEKFLSVRPGVTGHWQVSGRSRISYPKRSELELTYIDRQGFLFDMGILLKTIPMVLLRRGAH